MSDGIVGGFKTIDSPMSEIALGQFAYIGPLIDHTSDHVHGPPREERRVSGMKDDQHGFEWKASNR